MPTICLTCRKSTGVGEEGGAMGLPTLEQTPRGDGDHPFSRILSSGGDADEDETFGRIYSGFKAVGLTLHMLEAYREFLEAHTGEDHRLYDWVEEHEDPPTGFDGEHRYRPYEEPETARGFVKASLSFDCIGCGQSFDSDHAELVRSFEATTLSSSALQTFRECTVRPAEFNMHDVYPFDIEYGSLETWFEGHEGHTIRIRLTEE